MYIFNRFYYFIKKNYLIFLTLYFIINIFFQIYIIYFSNIPLFHSFNFILHVDQDNIDQSLKSNMETTEGWNLYQYKEYFPKAIDWNSKSIDYIDFNKLTVENLEFYANKPISPSFSHRYPLRDYLGIHFFWARSDLDITAQEYCDKWNTIANFGYNQTNWFKSSMRSIIEHYNGDIEKALPDAIKTIQNNNKKEVFYHGIKFKYVHYK